MKFYESARDRILAALEKPQVEDDIGLIDGDKFNPWGDVVLGISGHYAEAADTFMVELLEAVQNQTIPDLRERHGLAADMGLFTLAGQGMLDYGGSPYGGWVPGELVDLWQPLIDKWKEHNNIVWGVTDEPSPPRSMGVPGR